MEKACSLDIYKDSVFGWILDEQRKKLLEKRYGTLKEKVPERSEFFSFRNRDDDRSRNNYLTAALHIIPLPKADR